MIANTLDQLGRHHLFLGHAKTAEPYLRDALAIRDEQPDEAACRYRAMLLLAICLLNEGQTEEAGRLLESAREGLVKALASSDDDRLRKLLATQARLSQQEQGPSRPGGAGGP